MEGGQRAPERSVPEGHGGSSAGGPRPSRLLLEVGPCGHRAQGLPRSTALPQEPQARGSRKGEGEWLPSSLPTALLPARLPEDGVRASPGPLCGGSPVLTVRVPPGLQPPPPSGCGGSPLLCSDTAPVPGTPLGTTAAQVPAPDRTPAGFLSGGPCECQQPRGRGHARGHQAEAAVALE